jgi:hypothetical protein
MSGTAKRNRLMPWMIGLVLILAALAYAGWEVVAGGCGATPPATLVIALLVMPAVYLGLMYLTLTSQE